MYADCDLPDVAWALQNAGQGLIVLDEARGDRIPNQSVYSVEMGEGIIADVRVGETLGRPGGVPAADTIVRSGGDDALAVALRLVRRPAKLAERHAPERETTFAPVRDSAYPEMRYPALPYRVLAAFRYWNAIRYFYPSPMPPETVWDDVLLASIRRLEAARDSVEYELAVAAMAVALRDGHAQAPWSASHLVGDAGPRILLQFIEGHPVVTHVVEDASTGASGIAVGGRHHQRGWGGCDAHGVDSEIRRA
jgi:hypothetical protein